MKYGERRRRDNCWHGENITEKFIKHVDRSTLRYGSYEVTRHYVLSNLINLI